MRAGGRASAAHRWKFFRAGGVDQVTLEKNSDLAALKDLDQKLWVALSCPTHDLEFDSKTLDLLDTDHDGHVRAPEIIAAVNWIVEVLKDPIEIAQGADALPLSSIRADIARGRATARRGPAGARQPRQARRRRDHPRRHHRHGRDLRQDEVQRRRRHPARFGGRRRSPRRHRRHHRLRRRRDGPQRRARRHAAQARPVLRRAPGLLRLAQESRGRPRDDPAAGRRDRGRRTRRSSRSGRRWTTTSRAAGWPRSTAGPPPRSTAPSRSTRRSPPGSFRRRAAK